MVLLCFDTEPNGGKFVAAMVPTTSYDPYYQELAEQTVRYINKHGVVPGEHTLDLLDKLKRKFPDRADGYDAVYNSMLQTKEGVNRDYVVAQAQSFVRYQQLRAGITQAIDALDDDGEDCVEQAEATLNSTLKESYQSFDVGTRFNNTDKMLAFFNSDADAMPTGIPQLDEINAGPSRKALHTLIGLSNKGKSWWLIHLGRVALAHRLKVLHITLEMSEAKVAQRYLQSLLSISKRKTEVMYPQFMQAEDGLFAGVEPVTLTKRPYFDHPKAKSRLTKKLNKMRNLPLVIKQFPPGSLTIQQLKGYMDNLEGASNFIPDVLMLDYADDMQLDSGNYRHDLGIIYKQLRAIAVERNIAVCTVSQANRAGHKAKWVTREHVAEDWSKISTADTVLTYSQSTSEEKLGMARLFVDKGRDDIANIRVLISQSYTIGQFCMDSVRMADNYWDYVEDAADPDGGYNDNE